MVKTSAPLAHQARRYALVEGEVLTGTVVKLSRPGEPFGHWLVLNCDGRYLALPATAKRGWTVLERALCDKQIGVGDTVEIVFAGWRRTSDGERRYRDVRVGVVSAPGLESAA